MNTFPRWVGYAAAVALGALLMWVVAPRRVWQGAEEAATPDTVVFRTSSTPAPVVSGAPGPFGTTAQRVVPCVVSIQSVPESGKGAFFDFHQDLERFSSGSGVLVSADGYVVTNEHVVGKARRVTIILSDRTEYEGRVVGTDPSTDLAVVKVDATGLPSIVIANSDLLNVGDWVMAVGTPFELASTVTAGIVSAKGRFLGLTQQADRNPRNDGVESLIQTDAAVNPGNSGGALVNLGGELVGINTAIQTTSGVYQGYGFAVPSNLVKKVAADIIQYGAVQRAYMGIRIAELTYRQAVALGNPTLKGVQAASVVPGGAAARAGVAENDIITAVDGKPITTTPELLERLALHKPGHVVAITLWAAGATRQVRVTLLNRNGTTAVVRGTSTEPLAEAEEGEPQADEQRLLSQLGATFTTATPQQLQPTGATEGVVLSGITPGSAMAQAGVPEGFVLTEIDQTAITDPADVVYALKEAQQQVTLRGYAGTSTLREFTLRAPARP